MRTAVAGLLCAACYLALMLWAAVAAACDCYPKAIVAVPPMRDDCTYDDDPLPEYHARMPAVLPVWCEQTKPKPPPLRLACHTHVLGAATWVSHCYFGPWADIRWDNPRSNATPWWTLHIDREKWHRDHFWGTPPADYDRMDCVNGAGWKAYDKLKGCHAEALQAYDERIRDWRFTTEVNYPHDRLDVSQTPWWWPERFNDWLPPMPNLDDVWTKIDYEEHFGFWPPVGSCDPYVEGLCTPDDRIADD